MGSFAYHNKVLRHLDAGSIERLGLRPLQLELAHEMEYPARPIRQLFFLEEGMASMTVTMADGSQVEAGMFGYESVVGISALMGVRQSLNRVYMQLAGHGFSSPVERARREFSLGGMFHDLSLRCVQAQLTQSMQSAACNAKHTIDQRLARWLLICADRANRTTYVMSQEFLSEMLGSTRPSVSIAAGLLKEQGLLEYTRGTIHIPDRKRLEARACECYHVVRDHLESLTEFDAGFVA